MQEKNTHNEIMLIQKGNRYPASKSRRDVTGLMIDDFVGLENEKSKFQLSEYNPAFWQFNSESNNCYAYACNIRARSGHPHPGYYYLGRAPDSRDELLWAVNYDGIVKIAETDRGSIPVTLVRGNMESPAWIVALCDGYVGGESAEYGYHWYRKVWSGFGSDCEGGRQCFWSHKFYNDPVTNTYVNSNALISDPAVDAKARGYNFIGYFLIPPDITIYGPE